MPKPLSELDADLAKRIELVGFDVDGVLTDGGVYLGSSEGHRIELKRFDIQDRVGIKLLRDAGVPVVWVSGRVSTATTLCADEIGIDALVQDDKARKLDAFEELLEQFSVTFDKVAFVGDDLPDIPLLRRVGLPVTVSNAVRDVAEVAQFTTASGGGRGAVREFCEELLRARGDWDPAVGRYLAERDNTLAESTGAFTTT